MSQVEKRGVPPSRSLRPVIDAQYGRVRFITLLQSNPMAASAEPKTSSRMTSFADGVLGFATVGLKMFIATLIGSAAIGAVWVISRLIVLVH
ncbi:hypothetical protein SAMN05519104_7735 [Rhizobiales bacterium GAS188]|nr:hypothetical protein SAMN05519104_7735 [Rhizobiales bacterium GAS188]